MKGTPFISKDEKIQRKVDKINKKPWEQEVRDEQGRKRFHGAFTGGFSAGYFNSVGTKEGWAPKTFLSSRTDKKDNTNQTVFDYMDEDDIKEQIGTHTISAKDNFKEFNLGSEPNLKSVIPGDVPNELVLDHNNMMGNKLMKAAGYLDKEKDSKPKRVFTCNFDVIETKKDDNKYYTKNLEFKDDNNGIGFKPSIDEMFSKKQLEDKEASKNKINMGKFSDDTDRAFFNSKDMSEYNFEEIDTDDNQKLLKHNQRDKSNFSNQGDKSSNSFNHNGRKENAIYYIKSDSKLQIAHVEYKLPKLPENYDPFKPKISIVQTNLTVSSTYSKNAGGKLDANKRADILGEKKDFNNKFRSMIPVETSNLSKNAKIDEINNIQSNALDFKVTIPFTDDPAKLSRFAKFIAEKEGLFISESFFAGSNMMTGSQLKEEKILFVKLFEDEQKMRRAEDAIKREVSRDKAMHDTSKLNKDTDAIQNVKSLQEKMELLKNKLTKREKVKWRPEKLVCKRFELRDPFENVVLDDIEKHRFKKIGDKSFERGDDLNNAVNEKDGVMNNLQKDLLAEEVKMKNLKNSQSFIKTSNHDINSDIIVNTAINKSIFDQIFED